MPLPWRLTSWNCVSSSTPLNEPAATFGYDSAERGGDHPPIGDAHLYFEIVALAERNFLVLLNLGQTPVIGATIFEFDLALLDPGFLDFEFSQDRLGAGQCQPPPSRRRPPQYRPGAAAFAVALVFFRKCSPQESLA